MSGRRSNRMAATATHRTGAWLMVAAMVLAALGALYVVLPADDVGASAEEPADDEAVVLAAAEGDAEVEEFGDAPALPASVTHDTYLARDPFDPVVPEPEPAAVDPGTSADTSDATAIDDDTSQAGDDSDASGDDTSTVDDDSVCNPGAELVCQGRVVALLGITSVEGVPQAVLQVDGATYQVPEGEIFADVFQLQTIGDECVTVLYGDEAFELCPGDRRYK